MSGARRLFFAIVPDDAACAVLGAHLREHAPQGLPGKPVASRNWHITLRFLGSVAAEAADLVRFRAEEEIGGGGFEVQFGGLGAFPRPRRAAVLWLGVERGADRLADLAGVCDTAAVAAGLPPEERPFHPHLTLARIRPPCNVDALVSGVPPVPVSFPVREVLLFESRTGPSGPTYEVVDRFPL